MDSLIHSFDSLFDPFFLFFLTFAMNHAPSMVAAARGRTPYTIRSGETVICEDRRENIHSKLIKLPIEAMNTSDTETLKGREGE